MTQKGLDLLRRMDRPIQDKVQAAARCLSDAEVGKLPSSLERIRETASSAIAASGAYLPAFATVNRK